MHLSRIGSLPAARAVRSTVVAEIAYLLGLDAVRAALLAALVVVPALWIAFSRC